MKNQRIFVWALAWTLLTALVPTARAQSTDTAVPALAASDPDTSTADLAAQIALLRADQQATLARLKELEAGNDRAGEVATDAWQEGAAATGAPEQSLLRVYGSFDMSFHKNFFASNSSIHLALNDHSSFLLSNVTVFLGAQMTETLSALTELRFMFLPNGMERAYDIYVNGGAAPVSEYERDNTWVRNSSTTEDSYPGSVLIERAHLTWAPRDWFKVLAGRFLTPYGIWNVEHGATVIIPIHAPYGQMRRVVPTTQLGLQVFGSLFLRDDTSLEYYVTLSNGRDGAPPTETGDLNEDKALGLGLRLNVVRRAWSLSAGGYGFTGRGTDRIKRVNIDTQTRNATVQSVDTLSGRESSLSGFALLRFLGVRLQGEYVFRRSMYDRPGPLEGLDRIFLTGDLTSDHYGMVSNNSHCAYGLVAYELPLRRWLGDVGVVPYLLYENNIFNDAVDYINTRLFSAGVNVRPSAWITLKLEYTAVTSMDDRFGRIHAALAQLAVSF